MQPNYNLVGQPQQQDAIYQQQQVHPQVKSKMSGYNQPEGSKLP